jgi:opacity protein-like surface antigen
MKFLPHSLIIAALLAGVTSTPAAAQAPEERITVTFTPALATVGGDTELALAASAGYRFTDHLSFEGEFTWLDAAASGGRDVLFPFGSAPRVTGSVTQILSQTAARFGAFDVRRVPGLPNFPIPVEGYDISNDGQTVIGTLGLRYEPAVQTARFRPYLSGGLGFNHTEQEVVFRIATVNSFDETISHSGFAFSAGGGAAVRLFSSVWAGADAKYFRLSRDRNVIRFGGSLGLRF